MLNRGDPGCARVKAYFLPRPRARRARAPIPIRLIMPGSGMVESCIAAAIAGAEVNAKSAMLSKVRIEISNVGGSCHYCSNLYTRSAKQLK